MSNETVRYVDTPVELEINGRRCQYAPMRMEWSFDPDAHPLEEETLEFEMRDEVASVLQIHMTEACNLRCTYCSHFLNPKKGSGALTEDEIEMLLERIHALPEDGTLILHGGEPFLQAEATLRFAEASPCTAVIFTNGTLLTPAILDRLRGTNALLLLSADGDPSTTAQKRCGPRNADMTDEIFAGLELVSRSGVAWGIPMILGDHNIDDIEGQLLYLKDRYDPDSFGVQHQHYVAKGAMDEISAERIASTYGSLLELSRRHGVYVDQLARRITPMVSGKPLLKDCSACGTKLVYHPGGEWMNCTNNVDEDTSQHSWSRYLPVYTESCHGCIGIGVCGGGCIADAKALNPGGFDPRHCRSTRGLVRRVLEHCSTDSRLQTTDRDALRDEYVHLVQGAAESRATRSVGHHAVDADEPAAVQLPMAGGGGAPALSLVHVEGG